MMIDGNRTSLLGDVLDTFKVVTLESGKGKEHDPQDFNLAQGHASVQRTRAAPTPYYVHEGE